MDLSILQAFKKTGVTGVTGVTQPTNIEPARVSSKHQPATPDRAQGVTGVSAIPNETPATPTENATMPRSVAPKAASVLDLSEAQHLKHHEKQDTTADTVDVVELSALVNRVASYNGFTPEQRKEALEIGLADLDAALECFRILAAKLPKPEHTGTERWQGLVQEN